MVFTNQTEEFVFRLADGSVIRESVIPEMEIDELKELLDQVDRQFADIHINKQNYLADMAEREANDEYVDVERKGSILRGYGIAMTIQKRLRFLVLAALKDKESESYRDERYQALLRQHEDLLKSSQRVKRSRHRMMLASQAEVKKWRKKWNEADKELKQLRKQLKEAQR